MSAEITESSIDKLPLIGFDEPLRDLLKLFQEDRLPQVLLFTGIAAIGKSLFVRRLVQFLSCESASACGSCFRCEDILGDRYAELLYLDEPQYKVDHAREVRTHLQVQPGFKKSGSLAPRIAVFIDFDRANLQTQNQLLKAFEEPAPGVLVILTTSRPGQLLPTILSRAVSWRLRPAAVAEIGGVLRENGWDCSAAAVAAAYRRALGQTAAVLRELADGEQDERSEVEQLVVKLLKARSVVETLGISAKLVKERKVSLDELTRHITVLLNDCYRSQVVHGYSSRFFEPNPDIYSWKKLRRWRQSLAKYRLAAIRKKIPLNSQMVAESFFVNSFE